MSFKKVRDLPNKNQKPLFDGIFVKSVGIQSESSDFCLFLVLNFDGGKKARREVKSLVKRDYLTILGM